MVIYWFNYNYLVGALIGYNREHRPVDQCLLILLTSIIWCANNNGEQAAAVFLFDKQRGGRISGRESDADRYHSRFTPNS
jgi:hypothetical protein